MLECLSLSDASILFAGKARACPSGAQLKIGFRIVCKKVLQGFNNCNVKPP